MATHLRRTEAIVAATASIAFIAANTAHVGPFAFSSVEVAAFVTGAWCVWLCARNDIRTWPVGVVNGAIFVWLFWSARLYADALINCWFVVVGLYGWWYWRGGDRARRQRPVTRIPTREALIHGAAIVLFTLWAWQHLERLGDSAPFLDALTSALSISAFAMQARRQLESWWLWIAADLIYVPLYIAKGLPLTGALYLIFLAMCLVGVRNWRNELAKTTRRFRHGVVAGKFMPYHRGHRLVIATALAQCDHVTVLVCAKRGQPIDAATRAGWIRRSLPDADVVIVDQDAWNLPDDDSQAWADATIRILGHAPEAAFTSETYGDTWAAAMGADHVSVDPERSRVPISATTIRNDPAEHLGFLEPHVARHYQPLLVCILGAESTGKSTLARDLADHLDIPWIPEYGRIYTELLADPHEHHWTEQDFIAIAEAQNSLEDTVLATSHADAIICDTAAAVTAVFCEEYTGKRSDRVEKLAAQRHYDLYLLTDPATPFQQDATGLREDGPRRRRMHDRYEAHARATGTPTVHLAGSRDERLEQAAAAVDGIVAKTARGRCHRLRAEHASKALAAELPGMRRGRTIP